MEASRVVTLVSKVGVVVIVGFIGVTVFRKTSPVSSSAQQSAMRPCMALVQADLEQMIPDEAPTVLTCQGSVTGAVCSVETTVEGTKRTGPLSDWDCSKRHVPDGFGADFGKAFVASPEGVGLKISPEFMEGVQYAAGRIDERRSLLRNQ